MPVTLLLQEARTVPMRMVPASRRGGFEYIMLSCHREGRQNGLTVRLKSYITRKPSLELRIGELATK